MPLVSNEKDIKFPANWGYLPAWLGKLMKADGYFCIRKTPAHAEQ